MPEVYTAVSTGARWYCSRRRVKPKSVPFNTEGDVLPFPSVLPAEPEAKHRRYIVNVEKMALHRSCPSSLLHLHVCVKPPQKGAESTNRVCAVQPKTEEPCMAASVFNSGCSGKVPCIAQQVFGGCFGNSPPTATIQKPKNCTA